MTVLTDDELAAWLHRLSGGVWHAAELDGGDPALPEWFLRSLIRFRGLGGMHQLSHFGVMDAADPQSFEAGLLRAPVGELMLFSTLQQPHTVTRDGDAVGGGDIVIIGLAQRGGQRLRTPSSIETLSAGRVGFMSSFGSSVVEHIGATETTGVVVPASFLPRDRGMLDRGAGLFPDSPITRVVGAAVSRFVYEWLQSEEHSDAEIATTEATLLSLIRSLYQQLPDSRESGSRAEGVRIAAKRVIERRHRDADFGLDELAQSLHISRRQLFRSFEDAADSAGELLLRRRLDSAREKLLRMPPQDVETVAAASGFVDAAALRAQFARRLGMSPSEFRRTAARHADANVAHAMLLSDEQNAQPPI